MKKIAILITIILMSITANAQQRFNDEIYPTNMTPRTIKLFGYHNRQRLTIGTVDVILKINRTPLSGTPYEVLLLSKYSEDEPTYKNAFSNFESEKIEQSLSANLVKVFNGYWNMGEERYIKRIETRKSWDDDYRYYSISTESMQKKYLQELEDLNKQMKEKLIRLEEEKDIKIENDFSF